MNWLTGHVAVSISAFNYFTFSDEINRTITRRKGKADSRSFNVFLFKLTTLTPTYKVWSAALDCFIYFHWESPHYDHGHSGIWLKIQNEE